ncbi:S-adenosyl-L-methionine-dependent methyltransferase [Aspergillus campestris IBT 28561]|uniref:S-adenosyl-L-methionine-dependent methyltransferase n=1 Tax=Aspergillus campestris (strain IBT 28561) TaxID=1392248 RepID=A0A2I1CRT7_ASPC2|nr:S-adenosyl-L-methionine-dependent methyltransferase [Aspergillus campestris IBT 28561]PKY00346.1 S-adenosyl-L-methionine-dependent methyltransferase [Aspergillus campestris IBT 28561]
MSARTRLLEACTEISHLAAGPYDHLITLSLSHRVESALQYACHFNLASYVPVDGRIPFSDLSTQAGVPTSQCTRILRLLMTYFVFCEPEPGYVSHTPDSALLLDERVHSSVGLYTDESLRCASFLSTAAEKWPGSEERTETAYNLALNTPLPMFEFLQKEPARAQRFRNTMASLCRRDHLSLDHLVEGFNWGSLPDQAVVADIGGSSGHCSKAIAAANPHLRFIVQDLEVALGCHKSVKDMNGQIQYMPYDFFTPQPVQADIYLLRWILHDYPDKYAAKILQMQIQSMPPGSRIILMESVMMPPGTESRLVERKARILDIGMMSLYNSAERDMDAWVAFFNRTDPRLRLVNVVKSTGSALSVMELQLAAEP